MRSTISSNARRRMSLRSRGGHDGPLRLRVGGGGQRGQRVGARRVGDLAQRLAGRGILDRETGAVGGGTPCPCNKQFLGSAAAGLLTRSWATLAVVGWRRAVISLAVAGMLASAAGAQASRLLIIDGAGDGHGVGMSQTGAQGFALHGYSALQILSHYYTGTTVGRLAPGHARLGAAPVGAAQRRSSPAPSRAGTRRLGTGGRVRRDGLADAGTDRARERARPPARPSPARRSTIAAPAPITLDGAAPERRRQRPLPRQPADHRRGARARGRQRRRARELRARRRGRREPAELGAGRAPGAGDRGAQLRGGIDPGEPGLRPLRRLAVAALRGRRRRDADDRRGGRGDRRRGRDLRRGARHDLLLLELGRRDRGHPERLPRRAARSRGCSASPTRSTTTASAR